jgi:hypothetical protein
MAKVVRRKLDRNVIRQWIKEAGDNAEFGIMALGQEIFKRAVRSTPVDTGYLWAGWRITVNAPDKEFFPTSARPPEGQVHLMPAPFPRSFPSPFKIMYITNNVEYAAFVEFGTIKMAGRFMLTRAVAEVSAMREGILRPYTDK